MRAMILSLAVALAVAAPAQADDGTTASDLKCLLLTIGGMSSRDPQVKEASTMGMLYYLGRINGREPGIDVPQALVGTMKSFRAENAEAESERCGRTMIERGQELQKLAEHLKGGAAKPGS